MRMDVQWEASDVRSLRGLLGISQEEMGKRLGVTGVTVCHWETGKREPGKTNSKALEALKRALPSAAP